MSKVSEQDEQLSKLKDEIGMLQSADGEVAAFKTLLQEKTDEMEALKKSLEVRTTNTEEN